MLALAEVDSFSSTPVEKSVQILTLEPEPAPIAELGGRDRALSRPSSDRLLVYAEVLRSLWSP